MYLVGYGFQYYTLIGFKTLSKMKMTYRSNNPRSCDVYLGAPETVLTGLHLGCRPIIKYHRNHRKPQTGVIDLIALPMSAELIKSKLLVFRRSSTPARVAIICT